MSTADIAGATAACLVADRAHLEDARRFCVQLGGFWRDGVEVWERHPQFGYVVLLANSLERIKRSAPTWAFATDEAALALAARAACAQLSDCTCAWIRFLEPKAEEVVGAIVLADAVPKGHA